MLEQFIIISQQNLDNQKIGIWKKGSEYKCFFYFSKVVSKYQKYDKYHL
jgi:hypothetical protein